MDIDPKIAEFKAWARGLGCPEDKIPTDKALKLLFRSNNKSVLNDMMKRILPRKEAKIIKGNIIVSKQSKIDGEINVATCTGLPTELQRFQKFHRIKDNIKETEEKIQKSKSHCETLSKQLCDLNAKKLFLNEQIVENKTRLQIYEVKSFNVWNMVNLEQRRNETLENLDFLSRLSNQGNSCTMSKKDVHDIIVKCFEYISAIELSPDETIEFCLNKMDAIPKHLIWKILLELLDESNKKLENMNNEPQIIDDGKEDDIFISKLHAKHISLCLDGDKIEEEDTKILKSYSEEITRFFKLITSQILRSQNGNVNNDLIQQYVEALISKMYIQGQIEYVQNRLKQIEIEKNQQQDIDESRISFEKNSMLCDEINQFCNKIQSNLSKSAATRDKLYHTQKLIQRLVEAGKMGRLNLNETIDDFAALSFNDSVLCSTKLNMDIDRQKTSAVDSFCVQNQTPPAISELTLFNTIPIYKLKKKPLVLELHASSISKSNDFISKTDNNYSNEHYLSCIGAQEEFKRQKKSIEMLQSISQPIQFNELKLIDDFDEIKLKRQFREQREILEELADKLESVHESIKYMNADNRKIFKFITDCPLRKYISEKRLFNNHPYTVYENQFRMYYRINNRENEFNG